MSLDFIDLFAGIGGFRFGMEQAGHRCVGFVEWDDAARISYQAIHDTEGEWSGRDIRAVDYRELPRADCYCFGFPCTDISKNGKGEGLGGNRSGLFYTVTNLIRKLKEEDKPRLLFIENVENLLSVNRGHDFLRLIIELDEIGYDAEWQSINSREHGAPQNRQRVYVIGHLRGASSRKVFPIRETYQSIELSEAIDNIRNIENGWSVKNATKQGYDVATSFDAVNLTFPDSKTRRGRVGKGYLQTLDRSCMQAIYDPEAGKWRRITPLEAWRAQGFPDWAFDRSKKALQIYCSDSKKKKGEDVHLYNQAGNSVSVPVIYQIAKRLA